MAHSALIALASAAPRSGKSLVANYLVREYGFTLCKLAGPLKAMTAALLAEVGYDNAQPFIEGQRKEDGIAALGGYSARHIMRTLGLDWGRDCLAADFWLRVWSHKVQALLDRGQAVVVDDMRFANELAWVQGCGGQSWFVYRPAVTAGTEHQSEGQIHRQDCDLILDNNGSIRHLEQKVRELMAAR